MFFVRASKLVFRIESYDALTSTYENQLSSTRTICKHSVWPGFASACRAAGHTPAGFDTYQRSLMAAFLLSLKKRTFFDRASKSAFIIDLYDALTSTRISCFLRERFVGVLYCPVAPRLAAPSSAASVRFVGNKPAFLICILEYIFDRFNVFVMLISLSAFVTESMICLSWCSHCIT